MKNTLGITISVLVAAACTGAYFLRQTPSVATNPVVLDDARPVSVDTEVRLSPPESKRPEEPAGVQVVDATETIESIELDPATQEGWLRMAPAPEDEPHLPQAELDYKASVKAELDPMAWRDIHAHVVEHQYNAVLQIERQMHRERLKGHFDIIDLRGITGPWGEELLPSHYQGTHWKAYDAGSGTAEVVRLSPVKFRELYEEQWRVEAATEMFEAEHNRAPGESLIPVRASRYSAD